MNIKPIPKRLLIHEAIYEEYEESGRYGENFKPPVILQHIRVNHESSLNKGANSETKLIKAVLLFDAVNSSASAEFEFKEKSKLTFDSVVYTVFRVVPMYAFKLHHYEVELA